MHGSPMAGAIVIWLIKLGDWIRDLTAAGSRRAISELLEFQSRMAWVIRDGVVTSVPASQLAVDDHVVVYPGDMIPVDGEIIDGHAMIDQKTITGEGLPVMRAKGRSRYSPLPSFATDNSPFAPYALARPRRPARSRGWSNPRRSATRACRIMPRSSPTDSSRRPWAWRSEPPRSPRTSIASCRLVIVDYGTGIRVAAPTAVLASMTHAARAGIIIKSGAHMERLVPGRHRDFRQDRHADPRLRRTCST